MYSGDKNKILKDGSRISKAGGVGDLGVAKLMGHTNKMSELEHTVKTVAPEILTIPDKVLQ